MPLEVYQETLNQLKAKEGCRVTGKVDVNRIPGNIHFSFHQYENIVHQLRAQGIHALDLSHRIVNFHFDEGIPKQETYIKQKFRDASVTNPLVGTELRGEEGNNTFVYFLNVIRTVYEDSSTKNYTLNQYTASKYKSKAVPQSVPAVFVRYDIAPIYVYYSFRSNSVMHFLVRIIAIIGGVITVAGIVVSFLQNSAYQLLKSN